MLDLLKISFRYANKVSVDDEVLVQENDRMIPAKVINVSNSILAGIYNSFMINMI